MKSKLSSDKFKKVVSSKYFMAGISAVVFATIFGLQLSWLAKNVNAENPISSPISTVSYYVEGQVLYHYLDSGTYVPVPSITVMAKSLSFISFWTTLTDSNGSYLFSLRPDNYLIELYDSNSALFSPSSYLITLTSEEGDREGIDFTKEIASTPSASVAPTAVPTPAPEPSQNPGNNDNNGNNGNSNNGNNGGNNGGGGSPSCNDTKPSKAPFLKSAVVTAPNEVTLTWTKAGDPVTYYLVSYGLKSNKGLYGNPNIGGKDTTSYKVKGLSANQTYFFKVRAGNGCVPGDFSNEVSIKVTKGAKFNASAEGLKAGILGSANNSAPKNPVKSNPLSKNNSNQQNANNSAQGNSNKSSSTSGIFHKVLGFFGF